jgi:ATP-binding cassette subfamily C protein CydC
MTTFLRLLGLFRPRLVWILVAVAVSAAASLASIGLMATSGWFITAMGLAGAAGQSMNYFTPAALIRALAIVRTGGRYLDRLVAHEVTFRLLADLRTRIFAALVPLVPGAVDDLRSGDLAARLGADIDRLELVFLRLVAPVAVAIAVAAVVLAGLASRAGGIAVAVAGLMAVGAIAVPILAALAGAAPGRVVAERTAALRARLVDRLEGLGPLLITGRAATERDRLTAELDAVLAAEGRVAAAGAFGQVGLSLAGDLAGVAALAIGVPLVASGALAGPDLTLAVLAAVATFEVFAGVPDAFAGLAGSLASARRVFALVDRTPAVTDSAEPAEPSGFDLVLDGVTLGYPGAARPALAGIDLTVPAGTRLAIVGASGAGKSSLAELLVRFRDPDAGTIRLGGRDLRTLALDTVRARVALVPQQPHLFTAGLGDNLRLARPEADPAALERVLADAGLAATVAALPEGLATPVGVAGATLSGGEARRVAVARALLAEADVLVLDEPSEGLDAATEAALLDRLIARTAGRTLVVITHRATALARMDRIAVMEDGRIVETGTHADLARNGAAFRRLFARIGADDAAT